MALFITTDDFKGSYAIPKDAYTTDKLERYIDEFEESYLVALLGAELFKDFKADYQDANPDANVFSEDRFKVIFEAILKDRNFDIIKSEGIKIMLLRFIYWEYMRDSPIKKNIGGNYKNKQANAEKVEVIETNQYQNYNTAVGSFQAIQFYIDLWNPENYDYDKFNGRPLKITDPL